MEGKEPENSTSFPSLAAHIWSESGVYVCICPWVGSWVFFPLQNPHFGLCALCVAGIKCSTLTVPFNSCQLPSQASKLILWLHKYFAFLGFWCFQSSCSYSSWEDLVSSCHQPSRCLCWPGAWGTPAWGAKHMCLLSLCGGVSGSSSSACTSVWWQHLSSSGQQVLRRWSGQTDSLAVALTPPRTSGAFLTRRRWGKNLLWRCQLFFSPLLCHKPETATHLIAVFPGAIHLAKLCAHYHKITPSFSSSGGLLGGVFVCWFHTTTTSSDSFSVSRFVWCICPTFWCCWGCRIWYPQLPWKCSVSEHTPPRAELSVVVPLSFYWGGIWVELQGCVWFI